MIVFIDDDQDLLDINLDLFSDHPNVFGFVNPLEAVLFVKKNLSKITSIIIDQHMRPLSGNECVKIFRVLNYIGLVVILSGDDSPLPQLDLIDFENDIGIKQHTQFALKPFDINQLKVMVDAHKGH
jgi:DNA-binding NtrC family response regulator